MLGKIYTFTQVKEYLQIGKDTLLKLLHSGELKGFRIKGRWRIHEDDLKEYVDNLRNSPKSA